MTLMDKNENYQNAVTMVREAGRSGDAAAFDAGMLALAQAIEQKVLDTYDDLRGSHDTAVLAARGIRQLTHKETQYYNEFIERAKGTNPEMTLKNMDVAMPTTIVNQVFEDLKTEHPLLDIIDFNYGKGVTELLLNADEASLATWSALDDEIVKEATSGFKKVRISQNKLSAFLPIAKSMLDLGPEWLDRYVRAVLSEALAVGLEDGIINGKGQTSQGTLNEPVGMVKDLSQAVDASTGYKDKTAVKVTNLDKVTMGKLAATFTKTESGKTRRLKHLILVVNPTDYLEKVMPASTLELPDGTFVRDRLPIKCQIVQSTAVPDGKAIIGDAKRYAFVGGIGKEGITQYSDHYHFLEDERVYLAKLYGHGTPVDNNCFTVLDISELQPAYYPVQMVGQAADATNLAE